jgi:hypothetical protein
MYDPERELEFFGTKIEIALFVTMSEKSAVNPGFNKVVKETGRESKINTPVPVSTWRTLSPILAQKQSFPTSDSAVERSIPSSSVELIMFLVSFQVFLTKS